MKKLKSPKRRKNKKTQEDIEKENKLNASIRELSCKYRETNNELYLRQLFDLIKNKVYWIICRRVYGSKEDPSHAETAYTTLLLKIYETIRVGKSRGKSKYPLEDPKVDQMRYIYGIMMKTIFDINKLIKRDKRIEEIIEGGSPLEKGKSLFTNKIIGNKQTIDKEVSVINNKEVLEEETKELDQ